jgi:hypothetical protein
MDENTIAPVKRIENLIFFVRGQKVLLDMDLADLYGVPTKVLKQAVRRNIDRFPSDFMFVLTRQEFASLRSQIVTSSSPCLKSRGRRLVLISRNAVQPMVRVQRRKKQVDDR